jgi:hypothetical protein
MSKSSPTRTTQIVTGLRTVPSRRSGAIFTSSAVPIVSSSSCVHVVIVAPPSFGAQSGLVLCVTDLFHPFDDLAVRAPGSKVTLAPRVRAGSGAWNRGSMRTVPVKYSSGPFPEGCEPLRLMSIFSSFLCLIGVVVCLVTANDAYDTSMTVTRKLQRSPCLPLGRRPQ